MKTVKKLIIGHLKILLYETSNQKNHEFTHFVSGATLTVLHNSKLCFEVSHIPVTTKFTNRIVTGLFVSVVVPEMVELVCVLISFP